MTNNSCAVYRRSHGWVHPVRGSCEKVERTSAWVGSKRQLKSLAQRPLGAVERCCRRFFVSASLLLHALLVSSWVPPSPTVSEVLLSIATGHRVLRSRCD